ncbi:MAG TPA: TonB family protein [Myxococcaceae bacterium]|jgi:protein TonB
MSRLHLLVLAIFALSLTVAPPAWAAGGRTQFNMFFQADFTDASYQKKFFEKVAKHHRPPAGKHVPKPGQRTVVQITVGKDGQILGTVVSTESGSKVWDEAVLAAVKKAAPFEKLPAGFAAPSLDVHFHVWWEPKP